MQIAVEWGEGTQKGLNRSEIAPKPRDPAHLHCVQEMIYFNRVELLAGEAVVWFAVHAVDSQQAKKAKRGKRGRRHTYDTLGPHTWCERTSRVCAYQIQASTEEDIQSSCFSPRPRSRLPHWWAQSRQHKPPLLSFHLAVWP